MFLTSHKSSIILYLSPKSSYLFINPYNLRIRDNSSTSLYNTYGLNMRMLKILITHDIILINIKYVHANLPLLSDYIIEYKSVAISDKY